MQVKPRNIKNLVGSSINQPGFGSTFTTGREGNIRTSNERTVVRYECPAVDVGIRTAAACTNELPIVYKNQPMYLHPITKEIIHEDTGIKQINCSNVMTSMYEISPGQWINLSSKLPASSPKRLELLKLDHIETFTQQNSISNNCIYNEADIEAAIPVIPRKEGVNIIRIGKHTSRRSSRWLQLRNVVVTRSLQESNLGYNETDLGKILNIRTAIHRAYLNILHNSMYKGCIVSGTINLQHLQDRRNYVETDIRRFPVLS